MGDLVPFNGWRSVVEEQLGELNDRAAKELVKTEPAPAGLPACGSWIRAVKVDDDARAKPAGPWHYVVGWDGYLGCLSTRCRRRAARPIDYGLKAFLGETPGYPYRSWERFTLLVEAERPDEAACQQCSIGLARDANKAARLAREALAAQVVDLAWDLVDDVDTTDAELGRRIRALMPVDG